MASTQYKMRYGQYTSEQAQNLSVEHLGTVVFSGRTKQIWIDGKLIADVGEASFEEIKAIVGTLSNLTTTDKSSIVNAINEVVERIGTVEEELEDKIAAILGGENLNKTLDTIKEIQDELLNNTTYYVTMTTGSDTVEVPVKRVVDENGVAKYYDNEDNLVATEVAGTESEEGVEYEEGYSELVKNNIIESLVESIADNNTRITTIEEKGLVSGVDTEDEFLTVESANETEGELTTKNITIGVKYGTFKTGRGNVLNPSSTAYTNGVATVEGVQNYIEERIVWDEFVQNAQDVADDITGSSEPEYDIPNDTEFDDTNIIFGGE